MEATIESLWPQAIENFAPLRTPGTILLEQASELGRKLKNVVTARVATTQNGNAQNVVNRFYLLAPALGNYQYELFVVQNSVAPLYPATVTYKGLPFPCKDEDALKTKLKEIFAAPQTVSVIQSLVSQSLDNAKQSASAS